MTGRRLLHLFHQRHRNPIVVHLSPMRRGPVVRAIWLGLFLGTAFTTVRAGHDALQRWLGALASGYYINLDQMDFWRGGLMIIPPLAGLAAMLFFAHWPREATRFEELLITDLRRDESLFGALYHGARAYFLMTAPILLLGAMMLPLAWVHGRVGAIVTPAAQSLRVVLALAKCASWGALYILLAMRSWLLGRGSIWGTVLSYVGLLMAWALVAMLGQRLTLDLLTPAMVGLNGPFGIGANDMGAILVAAGQLAFLVGVILMVVGVEMKHATALYFGEVSREDLVDEVWYVSERERWSEPAKVWPELRRIGAELGRRHARWLSLLASAVVFASLALALGPARFQEASDFKNPQLAPWLAALAQAFGPSGLFFGPALAIGLWSVVARARGNSLPRIQGLPLTSAFRVAFPWWIVYLACASMWVWAARQMFPRISITGEKWWLLVPYSSCSLVFAMAAALVGFQPRLRPLALVLLIAVPLGLHALLQPNEFATWGDFFYSSTGYARLVLVPIILSMMTLLAMIPALCAKLHAVQGAGGIPST